MNKQEELTAFRQNNLGFYVSLAESNVNYSKDLTQLAMLKRRAKEVKADITKIERMLAKKDAELDELLDRIDYLKKIKKNVKNC